MRDTTKTNLQLLIGIPAFITMALGICLGLLLGPFIKGFQWGLEESNTRWGLEEEDRDAPRI